MQEKPRGVSRSQGASNLARAALYIGFIVLVATGLVALLLGQADRLSLPAPLVVLAAVALAPVALCLGREILAVVVAVLLPAPEPLPSLPVNSTALDRLRLCVGYPVIITGESDIEEVLLTMRTGDQDAGLDSAIHLALVDFADSTEQHCASDQVLADRLAAGLAVLNADREPAPFAAAYRHRRWNQADLTWMGWERKRGKIMELNRLIADLPGTSFDDEPALLARLRGVDFVAILDVGGRLPNSGVQQLMAILAHPANRAVLDGGGHVRAGYGILQPWPVGAGATSTSRFRFATYGAPGAAASSSPLPSMYQRLFGQDFYLGQALYDPAVFRATLEGRIADNTVLSHDKLEGTLARAASIPHVALLEEPPTEYLADRQRYHRWVRGDFQLTPWILATPGHRGVPLAYRWFLLDDLFRHLRLVGAMVLFALVWLAVPSSQVTACTLVLLVLFAESMILRPVLALVGRGAALPRGSSLRAQLGHRSRTAVAVLRRQALRWLLWLVLLPDRTLTVLDAIARTLFRGTVSRRKMLQWIPSATVQRNVAGLRARRYWWAMHNSELVVLALTIGVAVRNPVALLTAGPILAGWLAAPQLAYWTSRTMVQTEPTGTRP